MQGCHTIGRFKSRHQNSQSAELEQSLFADQILLRVEHCSTAKINSAGFLRPWQGKVASREEIFEYIVCEDCPDWLFGNQDLKEPMEMITDPDLKQQHCIGNIPNFSKAEILVAHTHQKTKLNALAISKFRLEFKTLTFHLQSSLEFFFSMNLA